MAAFWDEMRALVDDRIRRLTPGLTRPDTAQGVLADRDDSGINGVVVLDGDAPAQTIVRISGAIDAYPGDTVSLVRTGALWTVVGVQSLAGLGEASRRGNMSAQQQLTATGGYETLTVLPGLPFVKKLTGTTVRFGISTAMWVSVANTRVQIGVRITGTTVDGVAYDSGDIDIVNHNFNTISSHLPMPYGAQRINGIPRGTHTVAVRWKRLAGGVITVDTNDFFMIELDERRRQG